MPLPNPAAGPLTISSVLVEHRPAITDERELGNLLVAIDKVRRVIHAPGCIAA
jgi:hypothetical protein